MKLNEIKDLLREYREAKKAQNANSDDIINAIPEEYRFPGEYNIDNVKNRKKKIATYKILFFFETLS